MTKWAYCDREYPELGSVGPFETEEEAREHAGLGAEDPVTFFPLTAEEAAALAKSGED